MIDSFIKEGGMHFCVRCDKECKFYPIKGRKSLACSRGHHYSPLANGAMHKSSTSLDIWYGIFKMLRQDQRLSCMDIKRLTCVTYKTAWRMKNQILLNLKELDKKFTDTVDGWDEPSRIITRPEIERIFADIDTSMEFNYRQTSKLSVQKLSERFKPGNHRD